MDTRNHSFMVTNFLPTIMPNTSRALVMASLE